MPKKEETSKGDNVETGARRLHSFVSRLERLAEEKKGLVEDIKSVMDEAGSAGFDKKVLREVLKRRAKDKADVEEFDAILASYETNLDSVLS